MRRGQVDREESSVAGTNIGTIVKMRLRRDPYRRMGGLCGTRRREANRLRELEVANTKRKRLLAEADSSKVSTGSFESIA